MAKKLTDLKVRRMNLVMSQFYRRFDNPKFTLATRIVMVE